MSALTSAIQNTGHYHVRLVAHFLRPFCEQWAPEQIAGWLKRQYPTDPDMQLSHETFYRKPLHSGARHHEKRADGAFPDQAATASGSRTVPLSDPGSRQGP